MVELMAAHGWLAIEAALWGAAAASLDDTGTLATVEAALARDGVDGVLDLAAVGPALGGLDEAQLAALAARVEQELAELLAA